MPDRFANGDASNDRGGLGGAREVTGFDPTPRAGTTAIGSPTSPRSTLARLRLVHPALADGAKQNRFSSPEAGIFAFSRIDAGDQVEYLIALNNAETATTASLETYPTRWGPPPARNVRR